MLNCDEHKLNSESSHQENTLSFSQDEEYWQDPAVIEAWDIFSKVSCNEKNVESSSYAKVHISKIATESVQLASDIPDIEPPSIVPNRRVTRSLIAKGFGNSYI